MSVGGAISTSRKGRVATVLLNLPERRNALCAESFGELVEVLIGLDEDPGVGCIVITGGKEVFAAGADLRELRELGAEGLLHGPRERLWRQLRETRTPLIAAVSGPCLGGGCELALACDLIIASESAMFAQPEVELGLTPGGGATQLLTHAVGRSVASEMVLAGRRLRADEALAVGLVARVVSLGEWEDEVAAMAATIAERPATALRLAKQALRSAVEPSLGGGLAFERLAHTFALGTDDAEKRIDAFLAHRSGSI